MLFLNLSRFLTFTSRMNLYKFQHQKVYIRTQPTLIKSSGKHIYLTPENNTYASITTKLAATRNNSGIQFWKHRVGESVAKHILENAVSTGTKTHILIEDYLNNQISFQKELLPNAHLRNMQPKLDQVNNIQFTEVALYSDILKTAGTCDCVGDYDGVLSILDWKTSRKKKQKAWIQDYFLQTTAYSIMYREMTGIEVKQGVVLITAEDGSLDENVFDIADYVDELDKRLKAYDNLNAITLPN
jgi:hypothetical protein